MCPHVYPLDTKYRISGSYNTLHSLHSLHISHSATHPHPLTTLSAHSSGSELQVPCARGDFYKAREELEARGTEPSQEDLKKLQQLLMKRAIATIPLYYKVHTEYGSTERLYKKGMLTEEVYNQVKALQEFINSEIKTVMEEAEEMLPGWGKAIWPKANEMQMQLEKLKKEREGKQDEDGSKGDAEEGEWESDDDAEEVETAPQPPKKAQQKPLTAASMQPLSSSSSSSSSSSLVSSSSSKASSAPGTDGTGTGTGVGSTDATAATEADRKRAERELLAEADREDAKKKQQKGSPQKKKK